MWTRFDLKTKAKEAMKGRYFNYLGVSLILAVVSFAISAAVSTVNYASAIGSAMSLGSFDFYDLESIMKDISENSNPLSTFISLLTSIFIIMPLTVGVNRWFIRAREEKSLSVSLCFSIFKKGSYLNTVGSVLYYNVFLFLWFLLFIIPGIVKSYAYRMIPYILADNPGIGAKRALKLSCMMTKGHKLDIFVLDLSFIGWYLLGLLACCIGIYGVVPYQNATNAELYDSLKKSAVEKGYCTMEELGYVLVV